MDSSRVSVAELVAQAAGLRRLAAQLVADLDTRGPRIDAKPTGATLCGLALLHHVVADEVLALPEPYRTAIIALYFDARSDTRSAARNHPHVPAGLAMLRRRFVQRSAFDRTNWAARMIAFARADPVRLARVDSNVPRVADRTDRVTRTPTNTRAVDGRAQQEHDHGGRAPRLAT